MTLHADTQRERRTPARWRGTVADRRWPTADLTIPFRAPVATGERVLADCRSRFAAGGVWEEDGEPWAAEGTLLAESRRLALIRT